MKNLTLISLFFILLAGAVLTAKREQTFVGSDIVSTGYVKLENGEMGESIEMLTTAYSKADSCHYPKGDKCLTASGEIAKVGVAACPRTGHSVKSFP